MGNPAVYGLRRFYNIMGAIPIGGALASIGNEITDTCSILAVCTVYADQKFYFRDTGIYLYSSADTILNIVADGTIALSGAVTTDGSVTCTLGAGEALILAGYGRVSTSTVAGASLTLDATYAYGEAIELRYAISSWTGIGSSFKAMYLRSEADLGGAYGLRCAEFYGVMDTSTTTGLSSLQVVYSEMLVKASASNRTLTAGHSIEANISIENQTGTLTLTNNIYCLYAKTQTGTGLADYTKVCGIKIAGRDDGTVRVFGNALDISDPEATVCTWTKGINLTTSCTTGISISTGTFTTAIDIGGTMTRGIRLGTHDWGVGTSGISVSDTDPLFQIGGKISGANVSAGVYASSYTQLACKYAQTNDVSLAASWNELYITGGTLDMTGSSNYSAVWGHVEVAGTVTTPTGNLSALNASLIIPATLINSGRIAGLQIDMILNNGYTDNGIIAGIQFGEHTDPGQNKIPYGLNFDTGACACFARFPDDAVIADADGSLGAAAGYILVNIGGNNYKLQTYATA